MTTIRLPAITAIIPTFGPRGVSLTYNCVHSILETHAHLGKETLQIIVVEDSEDEATIVEHEKSLSTLDADILFLSQANGGFARACNSGLQISNGTVSFLVNNDVEFVEPSLQILTDFAMRSEAGVVGCRLLYPNWTIQHAGITFVPTPDGPLPGYWDHVARGQHPLHPAAVCIRPGLVTGAVFGITRWAMNVCGLLDERYGCAAEDVDYALMCLASGKEPMYCGYTYALHHEGATRGATPEQKATMNPEAADKETKALAFLFDKWSGVKWQKFIYTEYQ